VKQNIEYLSQYVPLCHKQEKLKFYQEAVFQWEKKTDLIGSHDKDIFFDRHILNALNLLLLLNDDDLIIHDIGTGAGLPGIVCRLCDDNLNRKYVLFEKKYQKRSFLKQMIIQLDLKNIEVREKYPDVSRETSDVLTSRAYLGLQHLENYKNNFKRFILFKGKNYIEEIKLLNNQDKQDKIKIYRTLQDDSYLLQGDRDECFT
jgi:16S rRNA (guanine527-N7)-methyltransferase